MIKISPQFSSLFDRDNRKERATKAIVLMGHAINDERFRVGILETNFTDTRWLNAQGVSSTLNAQQIWNILASGTEQGSQPDNEWDLRVDLYQPRWRWSSAIGYADAGTIHTTFRFFGSAALEEIAAHWAHEWCHTAGFVHDFRATARRGKSVPYAVGDAVSRILGSS